MARLVLAANRDTDDFLKKSAPILQGRNKTKELMQKCIRRVGDGRADSTAWQKEMRCYYNPGQ